MGIRGLTNFVKRFETDLAQQIDMLAEINKWKTNNDGKKPIILIDLKEISYLIQRSWLPSILGGQYEYYNYLLQDLCQKLCRQAKLVFFMVGKRYTDENLSIFIPKAEFRHNNSMQILHQMREKVDLENQTKMLRCAARDSYAFTYNMKKLIDRFGDIHVTYIEHNREIVHHFIENSNQTCALITNDTDFLAFEGDFEVWLMDDIDIKQMTCKKIQKENVYARLGFDYGVHQMKLLGALSGTAYLPIERMINLIKELESNRIESKNRGKIWIISEYVRRETTEIIDNKPQFDLDKISADIFGAEYTPSQRNTIVNSLAIYDTNFNLDEISLQNKVKSMENGFLSVCRERDPFLFQLATDDVYIVKDIAFIDYQNCRSKTYPELIIPILMKICGILFQSDRDDRCDSFEFSRQICMKHTHNEPSKVTDETIIYPPMSLPDRRELIFNDSAKSYDRCRWALLKWILVLDDEFLEKIKRNNNKFKNLSAVIITLQYLLQQAELTPLEANVILYTEHQIRNSHAPRTRYSGFPNAEFVRIAHLFVKMYVLISHTLDACGLRDMTDLIRFDGPLFHKNMEEFGQATVSEMQAFQSTIEPVWIFP